MVIATLELSVPYRPWFAAPGLRFAFRSSRDRYRHAYPGSTYRNFPVRPCRQSRICILTALFRPKPDTKKLLEKYLYLIKSARVKYLCRIILHGRFGAHSVCVVFNRGNNRVEGFQSQQNRSLTGFILNASKWIRRLVLLRVELW